MMAQPLPHPQGSPTQWKVDSLDNFPAPVRSVAGSLEPLISSEDHTVRPPGGIKGRVASLEWNLHRPESKSHLSGELLCDLGKYLDVSVTPLSALTEGRLISPQGRRQSE